MAEFINKYISISPEDWKRVKRYSKRPENRRPPGAQAGIILKDFLDKFENQEAKNVQEVDKK